MHLLLTTEGTQGTSSGGVKSARLPKFVFVSKTLSHIIQLWKPLQKARQNLLTT